MSDNIKDAKRIVFKFGTNVLRDTTGDMAYERIEKFISDIAHLSNEQREIIIVTSGAVGLGAKKLGLDKKERSLVERQACASVGQPYVMRMWEKGFQQYGIGVAQILLTEEDLLVKRD